MPAKKYVSIINKGGDNIYIKDAEASDVANAIKYIDVYVGAGATAQDVMISGNHHDNVIRGDQLSITASSAYLWVILPSSYSPVVQMGGMNVPMTAQSNVTVSDVTYKVFKSSNQYTGAFSVSLV